MSALPAKRGRRRSVAARAIVGRPPGPFAFRARRSSRMSGLPAKRACRRYAAPRRCRARLQSEVVAARRRSSPLVAAPAIVGRPARDASRSASKRPVSSVRAITRAPTGRRCRSTIAEPTDERYACAQASSARRATYCACGSLNSGRGMSSARCLRIAASSFALPAAVLIPAVIVSTQPKSAAPQ